MREITTLQHEVGDDSVEFAALVSQLLSFLPLSLFPSAQSSEVFDGLWNDITK